MNLIERARRLHDAARDWRMPRPLVIGFDLARQLAESLPDRDSTPTQAVLKSIASIDVVRTALWPTQGNPVALYAARHGLKEQKSEQFVRLFWSTDLADKFAQGNVVVSDWSTITDCRGPLGHFAFTKGPFDEQYDPVFYYGSAVQMPAVLEGLWKAYNGRLHVAIGPGRYGGSSSEFTGFEAPESPLYGSAKARMDKLLARHRRARAQGVPRTYAFVGEPGTGKTSFARTFAGHLGETILKLGASSLAHATVKEMSFLLDSLRPDFVLIDDIDKVEAGNALSTLLDILPRFKDSECPSTLLLTANKATGFDPGFLRPERVDTWVEFELPDLAERREVLGRFAESLVAHLEPADLDTLATESEGLSQDYLRETIIELRSSGSVEEVVALLRQMKRLRARATEAKSTPKGAATPDIEAPAPA